MLTLQRPLASISKRKLHQTSRDCLNKTLTTRTLASFNGTIQLDYQRYGPPTENEREGSLLILHGLFGSKRNWNTLAKGFSESLQVPIYTLDLRNHGTSPHVSKMSYTNMAHDVLEFIEKRGLHQTTIIGHSMGGKVAMALALDTYLDTHQNLLKNLIVVDIAPNRASVSPEFHSYMEAMLRIEREKLKTRKEASDLLSNYEKDPSIRAFLLTNLETATSERPYAKFKIPVDTITECLPEIGSFPYTPEERVWQGRTLFIKGSRSKYINRHGIPLMKSFFPNHILRELNTGHLVHAERPVEFKEVVTRFMDDLGVE
ncbi:hypothetical protein AGABI1DRAFT_109477 [Agaricus bisporus var. burnettii JB137-S8]|uniref:AB hydrolase-1 domain-containing protein n=1 Tax=Agaricus bisporus var. burnettii (strain JB137-S8 / ATCC MYA-4627 / FGSC 10392) TaxID=597362 RepID=K5WJD0_AGABU|nr:uncharacterized protein AGABI1DRAFT_109477 [Agaricus bisporus var. burnettii JB137-S8]EKM75411.1 hypothetical protein AGABI1DRAFT_109477 [Agaricus bisporus var. burnettii JB137-S8]